MGDKNYKRSRRRRSVVYLAEPLFDNPGRVRLPSGAEYQKQHDGWRRVR